MQSLYGPKTRSGKDYKKPAISMAYAVIDGIRHDYEHARIDMELDAQQNVTIVWRAYSLVPGVRQGMKPKLMASAHYKTNASAIARSVDRQPFFTLETDAIQVGRAQLSGVIGFVLEDATVLRMQRFVGRMQSQAL